MLDNGGKIVFASTRHCETVQTVKTFVDDTSINFSKSVLYICLQKEIDVELTDIRPIVEFYHSRLAQVTLDFKRYLYPQINWDSRVIGIKGERGVGKTTMLLQRIKEKYGNPDETFYISLDHYWFGTHQLQDSLLKLLYNLDKAEILELLTVELKNYKKLVNPEKIYLGNTNLMYAFSPKIDVSTLRETFFIDQLSAVGTVQTPLKGDFLVNGKYLFEVGGESKEFNQIAGTPDSYLAIDGIETGYSARIPLWMFGLLY
jgi:predicted AAA+ superfamily ATPase